MAWLFTCGPAPMVHSYRLRPESWMYYVRIPVSPDICHRGCAYTVLQTVQRHGVYWLAMVWCTRKKLNVFRVGHSPGLWLSSVAILRQFA